MESLSDLVRRYQESTDEEERCRLMDEFITKVRPILWGFLAHQLEADSAHDALQQTLRDIAEGLIRFHGQGKQLRSWCFTIARRKLISQIRKRATKREQLIDRETAWEDIEAGIRPGALESGERLDLNQALEMLGKAKPPCVDYLWWRYVLGWDIEEIAQEAGKSYDAARIMIKRCLGLAQSLMG